MSAGAKLSGNRDIAPCISALLSCIAPPLPPFIAQVKKAAWSAMSAATKLNGNRDIAPCVSAMLSCIANPALVGETITKLSATTFVQV